VNDQSAKPARLLRPGDLVRVTLPAGRRIVRILALAQRRGPAPAARALYDDLTPPAAPRARTSLPRTVRPAPAVRQSASAASSTGSGARSRLDGNAPHARRPAQAVDGVASRDRQA